MGKENKKIVTIKNSFSWFNLSRATIFLLFALLFFAASPSLAQVGLMNGRFSTGETDNYLFWLQTYNETDEPFYTNHFYINKMGSVGIGTTTPTQKLHVNGGAQLDLVSYGMTPGTSQLSALTTVEFVNAKITNLLSGGASSTWALNGNNIYNTNSGNVGIGTATTGAKLTLVDHTNNVGGIRFRTAATAVDLWSRASAILTTAANFEATSFRAASGTVGAPAFSFLNDTNTGMYSGGTDILRFSTAGADRMTILANGNVGIGTSTPGGKLHVVGGASKILFSSTSNSYGQMQLGNPSGKESSMAYVGNLTAFGSPPTSSGGASFIWNQGVGLYSALGSQYGLANGAYGGLSFLADSNGGFSLGAYAKNWTIPPANGMIISGSVGIGTTAPGHKLSVAGSATNYSIEAGNQRIGNVADPDTVKDVVTLGFLNSSLSAFAPGGASSTWTLSGNNLYNNNLTGNVGIGTNNPQTMLTLGNNGWLSAINSNDTGYINMFRVNTNNQIEVGGPLLINQFQFATDSGYNTFVDMPVTAASSLDSIQGYALRVDGENILTVYSESDGSGGIKNKRVGINVTNPATADLDVNGYMRTQGINVKGFVSSPGIVVADDLGNLSSSPGLTLKTTYVNNVDYNVNAADSIIAYSAINGNRTVNIPDSLCTPGRFFVIMDQSGASSPTAQIIINPEGSTPIVGNLTFSLSSPYNSVYVFCGKPSGTPAWFLL